MAKLAQSKNRKAMMATGFLAFIGYVLGAMILFYVILPVGGKFLHLRTGTAYADTLTDSGFSRLIRQLDTVGAGTPVKEDLTISKGDYLVSFNKEGTRNGKAIKPPECGGSACLCICINDDCTKIDVDRNRGRDCRPLYKYDAIIAQGGIDGNSGSNQPNKYLDGSPGFYLYVKGFKTISVMLQEKTIENKIGDKIVSVTNLYIGK